MNSRRTRIYEGKAKILYEGPEPGTIIVHFKDDATAFNAQKKAVIEGKGVLNQRISEFIFTRLNELGIPTHFLRSLNMREQLVREVEIVPLEVVVRNVAAGSLADQGDLAGAIALLGKGFRLPKRPMEHHLRRGYALADLYERAGDLPQARALFSSVARAEPDFLDAAERAAHLA